MKRSEQMAKEDVVRRIEPGTRVLVTGATGFTGSALVRRLVAAGANVAAIARSTSNTDSLRHLPVDWFRGDISDPQLVEAAMSGARYVFHLATPYREAASEDTFRSVHVTATQLLAREALKQRGFLRFVHVSTIGVHGHIENPPADENYPMGPGDDYQNTKCEAELWIRDFSRESGLPLAVVRPAAIYGPGDKRLLKVFKMAVRKWVPAVGGGNHLYHLVHVEDLARFLIHAATHPDAEGEVFICGSPKALTYREMLTIIGESYGVKLHFVPIPVAPLFLLADVCEFLLPKVGITPPIYRRRVAFFTKDRSFDTRKMREVLDFRTEYSDERGLRETAFWYIDQGWLPNLARPSLSMEGSESKANK
jgi:dihydroflavonol-4-reductase